MQTDLPGLAMHTAMTCNGWYAASPDPTADKTHAMCKGCARLMPIETAEDGDIEPDGDGLNCPNRIEAQPIS